MIIRPERDLHQALLRVEKPGRYVGGEFGSFVPDFSAPLRIAICFPDLYEVGMTNRAIKILYHLFNGIEGVSAERVFAAAPDFENELKNRAIPLYSLESGTPLSRFDIIAFSVGYELAATTILSVLDLGGIPLRARARGSGDPIIIAGGPAVTNPTPFGRFVDAVFIGEAEERIPALTAELVDLKRRGAGREALLARITGSPSAWSEWDSHPVRIDRFNDFGVHAFPASMPVAGMRIVQDHGAVEIMRGCPHGCRFCHAGVFYRPYREKPSDVIFEEVERLVTECGYREITISSLSSGDYTDIVSLMRRLNAVYRARGVSFSLPSIRIDSFTLPLLEEVATVRKSGLTFAVETPRPEWQRGINKEVSLERTLAIMREAKHHGWKQAKLYFMLGLPVCGDEDEVSAIAGFIETVRRESGMHINVNVSTFVPKPHTPFQWARQLDEREADRGIQRLKRRMRRSSVAVRYNSPFSSVIEGIICRGDERVGELIEAAYRNGSRLDAWEDHFNRDAWRDAIDSQSWDVIRTSLAARSPGGKLPWDRVSIGVRTEALLREYRRALRGETSAQCSERCSAHCGVCTVGTKVRTVPRSPAPSLRSSSTRRIPIVPARLPEYVVDFTYSKTGRAVYLAHLDTLTMFARALTRAGLNPKFSAGFNPKPKIEFAHPLSLGYASEDEIARVTIIGNPGRFPVRLNDVLHEGFRVLDARAYPKPPTRLPSLMSQYWGSEYLLSLDPDDELAAARSVDILEAFSRRVSAFGAQPYVEILDRAPEAIRIRVRSAGRNGNLRRLLTDPIAESSEPMHDLIGALRVTRVRTLKTADHPPGFRPYS